MRENKQTIKLPFSIECETMDPTYMTSRLSCFCQTFVRPMSNSNTPRFCSPPRDEGNDTQHRQTSEQAHGEAEIAPWARSSASVCGLSWSSASGSKLVASS